MALSVGDTNATYGVSMIVYSAIEAVLQPPMVLALQSTTPPATAADIAKAVATAQANWKTLAYAIAGGLVTSLTQQPPATPAPPSPVFAQTLSTAAEDPFWAWLAGFVQVFTQTWAPATADGLALQAALKTFLTTAFGTAPDTLVGIPKQLTGVLR